MFPSLEGESLEDFSIRLAQRWRIGQKGLDNGAILLVFARERRVRLEVGYGLEPVVPDAVAGQIIREIIAPRFREGRYADGLEAAVRALHDRVGRDAERRAPARPAGTSPLMLWGFLAVVVVIAAILIQEAASARRFVRRNGYTAGRDGGWSTPVIVPPVFWGRRSGGGGGGGFSGGGGSFGGGGASGEW